jgi:hypothetical protein
MVWPLGGAARLGRDPARSNGTYKGNDETTPVGRVQDRASVWIPYCFLREPLRIGDQRGRQSARLGAPSGSWFGFIFGITAMMAVLGETILCHLRREPMRRDGLFVILFGLVVLGSSPLPAQSRVAFSSSSNVTGQMSLTGTVNLLQQAQFVKTADPTPGGQAVSISLDELLGREQRRNSRAERARFPSLGLLAAPATGSAATQQGLPVSSVLSGFGFSGLTHADQRNANGGNQFSVEPPSPALAVGEGFVVEGVNNALQVFSAAGVPLLPTVVSSNQLFGLPPAINRATGINGVYPTDMRVYYDAYIRRWFVFQWAQLNDTRGAALDQSREWLAVSQTPDPTATYNIYTRDTTNPIHPGCPCLPDYPLLGADQFGLYISANEYDTATNHFVDAAILAISKVSLASGAVSPTAVEFVILPVTGYEFAIHPAEMPPGAQYFMASSGVQYFVSSLSTSSIGNNLAIWVVTNTSSLLTSAPDLALERVIVPTQTYSFPDVAVQRPGVFPYGSSLTPTGLLPFIDGGDNRILSVINAGGHLYASLATQVVDENGRRLVGGAYFILSPMFRGGLLSVGVVRQGYLLVSNNNLLRCAIGVNSEGRGVVAFTLAGPDYYPSAAFVAIDAFTTGSTVQIVASGVSPEDGFTGYPNVGITRQGVARWGDSSAAVASSDGSIWFSPEYIPDAPRTPLANWGTFVAQYRP